MSCDRSPPGGTAPEDNAPDGRSWSSVRFEYGYGFVQIPDDTALCQFYYKILTIQVMGNNLVLKHLLGVIQHSVSIGVC